MIFTNFDYAEEIYSVLYDHLLCSSVTLRFKFYVTTFPCVVSLSDAHWNSIL